ncbi:MAG: 50S ribosomal protein L4 [Candidatus Omnitrophica bacterium]|nr:50S ribosomal protein L4 [Candidatus Omnitrophota bacterium]
MTSLPIYNNEGKEIDKVELNSKLFDGIVNKEAIYQAVNAHLANKRRGLASTKTRGEVSGGGRKPWKQKGTGRARVGSTRSPLWRHGGVVFGPHPKDFSYNLPEKIKNVALKSSLNAKLIDNNIIILDELKINKAKTKDAVKVLSNLKILPRKEKKSFTALVLLDKIDDSTLLSLRNIGFIDFNLAKNTHTYEVMSHTKLIVTKDALKEITNRLNREGKSEKVVKTAKASNKDKK